MLVDNTANALDYQMTKRNTIGSFIVASWLLQKYKEYQQEMAAKVAKGEEET